MPKHKTHSGVKDRFKVTKKKRVLSRKSHRNHNLSKKTASRKRTFGKMNNIIGKIGKKISKEI